jgi:transcriptional regulator with XRE-family HTH domain
MRQSSSAAGPQPSRPATMRPAPPYGVQMRSTSPAQRDTWATLVQTAREAAGIAKVELARRLSVDRATILRWETGATRPEQSDVVQRFADLFAIDLDTALAAAGLRPAEITTRPEPRDPDVQRLIQIFDDPYTSAATKDQIRTTMRALLDLAEAQPRAPRRARKAG